VKKPKAKPKINPWVKSLSQYNLGFELMVRLGSIYSKSGVSNGRALRACLLETITDNISDEDLLNWGVNDQYSDSDLSDEDAQRITDEVRRRTDTWDLCAEAKKRIRRKKPRVRELSLFLNLQHTSFLEFVCLGIEALLNWYEEDKKKRGREALDIEHQIVRAIYGCLDAKEVLAQFHEAHVVYTPEQLLQEGRDRWHRHYMMKRKQGWIM
jgi:hypothetical protein